MAIRVEEYVRGHGWSPYQKWFHSLDPQSAAKATTAKLRIELGNTSSPKWFAGMGVRPAAGAGDRRNAIPQVRARRGNIRLGLPVAALAFVDAIQ
jgi:hypothetical protein